MPNTGLMRKKGPLMPVSVSSSGNGASRQFQQSSPMQHYSARPKAGTGFQAYAGGGSGGNGARSRCRIISAFGLLMIIACVALLSIRSTHASLREMLSHSTGGGAITVDATGTPVVRVPRGSGASSAGSERKQALTQRSSQTQKSSSSSSSSSSGAGVGGGEGMLDHPYHAKADDGITYGGDSRPTGNEETVPSTQKTADGQQESQDRVDKLTMLHQEVTERQDRAAVAQTLGGEEVEKEERDQRGGADTESQTDGVFGGGDAQQSDGATNDVHKTVTASNGVASESGSELSTATETTESSLHKADDPEVSTGSKDMAEGSSLIVDQSEEGASSLSTGKDAEADLGGNGSDVKISTETSTDETTTTASTENSGALVLPTKGDLGAGDAKEPGKDGGTGFGLGGLSQSVDPSTFGLLKATSQDASKEDAAAKTDIVSKEDGAAKTEGASKEDDAAKEEDTSVNVSAEGTANIADAHKLEEGASSSSDSSSLTIEDTSDREGAGKSGADDGAVSGVMDSKPSEQEGVVLFEPSVPVEACSADFPGGQVDESSGLKTPFWYGGVGRASKLFDPFHYELYSTSSVKIPQPSCEPVFETSRSASATSSSALHLSRTGHSVARRLDRVADEDGPFPIFCDGNKKDLCEVVEKVAINREVMVAVANSMAPGLDDFLDRVVDTVKIKNFLVVALDDALASRLKSRGVPYYRYYSDAQGNHGVSAQKFPILRSFIEVGCSVLLTDTDVVYLQNPMEKLYRDTDVEGMSDGWDIESLQGYADAVENPLGGRLNQTFSMRIGCLNSGLWYISATHASLRLMKIMEHRLSTEKLWDQTGYNLELTLPSRDTHLVAGATMRVMSPWCFMNSKVYYRNMRQQPWFREHTPVAIHMNYHSDKMAKMADILSFYDDRDAGGNPALPPCNGEGCLPGTPGLAELEKKVIVTNNDSLNHGRQYILGQRYAIEDSCRPGVPWNGKLEDMKHELHRISGDELASAPLPPACGRLGELGNLFCTKAMKVAKDGEILVTVARDVDHNRLFEFLKAAHGVNMYNLIVVTASDKEDRLCSAHSSEDRCIRLASESLDKFGLMYALVSVGLSVLYADLSIVFVENPFRFLYRDSDVELMSNGLDDTSAYGYDHVVDDPVQGWSRYVHGSRMMSRSSSFVFVQATEDARRLLARMLSDTVSDGNLAHLRTSDRCNEVFSLTSAEAAAKMDLKWNLELFLPSSGAYSTAGVTVRVMNYMCFAHSRLLMSSRDVFLGKRVNRVFRPVVVNISHRERIDDESDARLASEIHRYFTADEEERDVEALTLELYGKGFVVSDHPYCKGNAPPATAQADKMMTERVAAFLLGTRWTWGGVDHVTFEESGAGARIFKTPWGDGQWGVGVDTSGSYATVDSSLEADGAHTVYLWMDFVGAKHVVVDVAHIEERRYFVADRCAEESGERILGRMIDS